MPSSLSVRAFAKLNVGLRILGRRPDGYHEIRTVYQTIALADRLEISLDAKRHGIGVVANVATVPSGRDNLVYRAAELWQQARTYRGAIEIRITKRIPAGGGLGGASSDAAAAMLGLERLTGDRLDSTARLAMAAELGSDVPFFLHGGRAFGCGRGEEICPLSDLPPRHSLVVFPGFSVSTAEAYREAGSGLPPYGSARPRTDALTEVRKASSIDLFGGRPQFSLEGWGPAENDFEKVAFAKWPELAGLKRRLIRAGAEMASLTGSGSSVYALFSSARKLAHASRLVPAGCLTFRTRTLRRAEYLKAVTSDE